jgi:hypothetical protein
MTITGNTIENNALAALTKQAAPQIVNAIKSASNKTGVNFAYLIEQAAAESSFKPNLKAKTSSATGLYQFIESTWLNMVKKHGHKYGMKDLAAQIDANGRVEDPETRQEILKLRKNPQKAAFLAAEFAAENKEHLEKYVGGNIGSTELYFAHFLGASGAAGFLNALKQNPLSKAADLFPREAKANPNVFFDKNTKKARSLADIYSYFENKFSSKNMESAVTHQNPSSSLPPSKSPAQIKPQYTSSYKSAELNNLFNPLYESLLKILSNESNHKTNENNSFWGNFNTQQNTDILLMAQSEMILAKIIK